MFSFVNRTVFDLPLTWNQNRFVAARAKCRKARKLVEISINVQYEKHVKDIRQRNMDIEKMITKINENLTQREKKDCMIENLIAVTSESISDHFEKRMEKVRAIVQDHCKGIEKVLREENIYWKEIQSVIEQNPINSNDMYLNKENSPTLKTTRKHSNCQTKRSIYAEHTASTKESYRNAHLNSTKRSTILPPSDETYVATLNETTNTETHEILPMETSSHIHMTGVHGSSMYSQPNPPAPICFSPTVIQDERSQPTNNVSTSSDKNLRLKPRVILNRISQEALRDYFKIQEPHYIENVSVIIDKIPSNLIHSELSIDKDAVFTVSASELTPKSCNTRKTVPEIIDLTKNTKQSRKRKQSVGEDENTVTKARNSCKRKSKSLAEDEDAKAKRNAGRKQNRRTNKENEPPIYEPSQLPKMNQSLRYSTRFSARSQRSNSIILSNNDAESDNEHDKAKTLSERRKKFTKKSLANRKTLPIQCKF